MKHNSNFDVYIPTPIPINPRVCHIIKKKSILPTEIDQ